MSLLDFQVKHQKAILKTLTSKQVALDLSDTGVGKTFISISVAKELNLKPIIICPKSIIYTWGRVCNLFKVPVYGILNYESVKSCSKKWYRNNADFTSLNRIMITDFEVNRNDSTSNTSTNTGMSVTNLIITTLSGNKNSSYHWNVPNDAIFIFDEAHCCKNASTENAKLLLATKNTINKVLLLSATLADKPKHFAVFADLLNLCDLNTFTIYLRRLQKLLPDIPEMSLIHRRIFPEFGSRLLITELGNLFPKNIVMPELFIMDEQATKDIQAQYELINFLSTDAQEKENRANFILPKICYARQKIEALKVPTIIDLAKQKLDDGLSVVIFVNFKDTLKVLAKELNTANVIYGEQDLKTRDRIITSFQENKEQIIICQIQTGGQGISLHDIHGGHPRISLISPGWSAKDLQQALGRIYRAEGKTPCLQMIVYCANTIEAQICEVLQEKIHNFARLVSGKSSEINVLSQESKKDEDNDTPHNPINPINPINIQIPSFNHTAHG